MRNSEDKKKTGRNSNAPFSKMFLILFIDELMFAVEIFALCLLFFPWVLGKAIVILLWEVLLRFFFLAVSLAPVGYLGPFGGYADESGPPAQPVIIKTVFVALPSPASFSAVDVNPFPRSSPVPPPARRPTTILETLRCSFPGCSCFLGAPCFSLAKDPIILCPSSASPVLFGCEAITKAWLLANSPLPSSSSGAAGSLVFGSPAVPFLEEMDVCLPSPLVSVAPCVSIPGSGSAVSSAAEVSSSLSPARVIAAPKGVRSHRVRENAGLKTHSATPMQKGDKGLKRLSGFGDRQDGK
ncbi:uncharacterized protein EV154DRAFT_482159 [Mucor mucedo]|uniref:uncharacterized protein n=1 Tax=Mucor mucedo TaxID=29922 RepID=UPI00221FB8E7|nr:uncharacterized protein EV154DRAFT_482159 [Mucor mucedo]KAI7890436.1 hypothetical protein EV154DRAFT_482159 [Mucor mucedo]